MHWRPTCYYPYRIDSVCIARASCVPLFSPSQPPCSYLLLALNSRDKSHISCQKFNPHFLLVQWLSLCTSSPPLWDFYIFLYSFVPFFLFPCAFMPLPFSTLTPFFLFLLPLFQDVSAFRSVLESWQSWNGTTSLEKSQRLLEFEVLTIAFQ